MEELLRELINLDINNNDAFSLFMHNFQVEMHQLSPNTYHSSSAHIVAENLMMRVFQIAKKGALEKPDALLQKMLSIYDSLIRDQQNGSLGAMIGQLCACLETFAKQDLNDIRLDLIGYCLMHIIKSPGKHKFLKEKCRELTEFLEEAFHPRDDKQAIVSSLLKENPKHRDYLDVTTSQLNKAISELSKLQKKTKNKDTSCDSGINFTIALLKNRILEVKANKIILEMEKNCKACKAHLKETIRNALRNNPMWDQQVKISVSSFISELHNQDMNIEGYAALLGTMKEDLRVAVDCYKATNVLLSSLNDEKVPSPIQRLCNAKNYYRLTETQNIFQSNPDGKVKQFFKKIGYLFGLLFTIGYGSFFMLPQAKLNKQANELFETASKDGVFAPVP